MKEAIEATTSIINTLIEKGVIGPDQVNAYFTSIYDNVVRTFLNSRNG